MTEDEQLLRQYTGERSERAFSELVRRHINLVYAAARRVAGGDGHLAEDVTQVVFIDLARKAWSLPRGVVLAGWLYRHACFTASKAMRGERRRQAREQTAIEMSALDHTAANRELASDLDEGLNRLSEADRDAIVLRFFQSQDFRAVGAALGISEDAAQKRVSRALDKLRDVLSRRGAALSATATVSLLTAEAATAAPAGLVASVTTASLTAAATAGSGFSLAAMKIMAMTKLQMTVAGVVLAAALGAPLLLQHQSINRLREENRRIRAEHGSLQKDTRDQVAALIAENQRLSDLVSGTTLASTRTPEQQAELLKLRGLVTRLQTDARTNEKSPDSLSVMMKNPEMKEMVRAQQRAAFSSMFDKHYTEVISQMHLSPEQSAALKELIIARTLVEADRGVAMVSGELDGADRAERLAKFKTDYDAVNGRIKELLGDDSYTHFSDYEKTVPGRMMLSNFKDQLDNTRTPLDPEQEKQFFPAVMEVARNFKYSDNYTDEGKIAADPDAYLSGEKWQRLMQEEEQAKQALLACAQTNLSPVQLAAFEKFLTRLTEMENARLQMSVKAIAKPGSR